jgi:hypothetical protein
MSMGTPIREGLQPSVHGDAYLDAYLFEEHYLEAAPDDRAAGGFADRAYRVTARCIARWCDWYWITRYWGPKDSEEGSLPGSPGERQAFVDALFDQPQDPEGPPLALSLRDGERWAFDAHDGFPGPIYLRPGQLEELRAAWADAGLPADLYYPVAERRLIVEPQRVPWHDAVLRASRYYSPRQWEHRDHAAIAALRVPTDEERRERLREASSEYGKALARRMRELAEPPGTGRESPEMDAVMDLQRRIAALLDPEGRVSPPHVPTAGWPSPPTARQSLESSLPALRRLHPDGEIVQIVAYRVDVQGQASFWEIDVWDPASGRRIDYRVIGGVPHVPRVNTNVAPRTRHRIMRLSSRSIRSFLDSDEAWRRAEEAGGRAFREQVGSTRSHVDLNPTRGSSALTWRVTYNEIRDFPVRTLRVDLDGRTGAGVTVQEFQRRYEGIVVEASSPEINATGGVEGTVD